MSLEATIGFLGIASGDGFHGRLVALRARFGFFHRQAVFLKK
jgi:hypothetical protein